MKVAIVGAGVSGLVAARVLQSLGDDVTVYETRPDVGGVWSATRRYPGLRTQTDKGAYSFSENPMPSDYPDFPSSAQVQSYLTSYVRSHGLAESIELGTSVTKAGPSRGREGWDLVVHGPSGIREEHTEWLVMANGICSQPHIPDLPGRSDFEAARGRVCAPSELTDVDSFAGRAIVVLGWGKSAADIAVAALPSARSVTMVARRIDWKLPLVIGRLTVRQLVLTRLGEYLLYASGQRHVAVQQGLRLLSPLRRWWLRRLEHTVVSQQHLEERGLRPVTQFNMATHLITPGFFEALDDGAIDLRRVQGISRLLADEHGPAAELADGSVVPADLVVSATGFDQDLSVLTTGAQRALLDFEGNLKLYRHTVPEHLPRIAFVGWHNTFRSPLTAEVQALWLGAHVHGLTDISAEARRARDVVYRLSHAHAAEQGLPQFTAGATFLDMDLWIREAGLRFPWGHKLAQVLRPMRPASYANLLAQLQKRVTSPDPGLAALQFDTGDGRR